MAILKNNYFFAILFSLASACQSTQTFDLQTFPADQGSNLDDLHIVSVDSNRIQQKCLFFNAEAENKWRHQYLMYVLNSRGEVFEIIHPFNQDEASCQSQVRKIEKVLKADRVRICVRNELKLVPEEQITQTEVIQFGPLGHHKIRYESLTLDSICNSDKCFSNNDIWVNTCPGFTTHEISR